MTQTAVSIWQHVTSKLVAGCVYHHQLIPAKYSLLPMLKHNKSTTKSCSVPIAFHKVSKAVLPGWTLIVSSFFLLPGLRPLGQTTVCPAQSMHLASRNTVAWSDCRAFTLNRFLLNMWKHPWQSASEDAWNKMKTSTVWNETEVARKWKVDVCSFQGAAGSNFCRCQGSSWACFECYTDLDGTTSKTSSANLGCSFARLATVYLGKPETPLKMKSARCTWVERSIWSHHFGQQAGAISDSAQMRDNDFLAEILHSSSVFLSSE